MAWSLIANPTGDVYSQIPKPALAQVTQMGAYTTVGTPGALTTPGHRGAKFESGDRWTVIATPTVDAAHQGSERNRRREPGNRRPGMLGIRDVEEREGHPGDDEHDEGEERQPSEAVVPGDVQGNGLVEDLSQTRAQMEALLEPTRILRRMLLSSRHD